MTICNYWRSLFTTLCFCASVCVLSTPAFADGGIRIHRANQFNHHSYKNNEKHTIDNQRDQLRLLYLLNKQHSRRRSSSQSQQASVPDSRFPNTYQALSYQQKLAAQPHKKR